MILGLLLVSASFLSPFFAPSLTEGKWTDEQALEHAQTSARLHALAHEKGHFHEEEADRPAKDKAALEREFAEAEAKYKEGDAKLAQAQSLPGQIAFWIRCSGALLLALGLAAFFRHQRHEA